MKNAPPLYASTRRERLPCIHQSESVLEYGFKQRRNLFLWDEDATGTGKTRTLYLLAYELIRSCKIHKAMIIRAQEFGGNVVTLTRSDRFNAFPEYLRHLRSTDFLGIDELDKLKLSDRVESEWFDLFERRIAENKFTVFTSNMSAQALASRFSEQFVNPILRRLSEFYEPFKFSR